MAGPFPTPSVRVPGLLNDTALQEQLKLFTEQQNRVSTQGPPPAAVEMAGKIQSDYIDRPLQSAMKTAAAVLPAPVGPAAQALTNLSNRGNSAEEIDEQQKLIDMRSDILSNDGIGGVIGRNLISGPLGLIVDKLSPVARLGALSPEEAQADAEQRLKDRQRTEAAVKADADARTKLRNMSDEDAAQLGLPIAPGGSDPQTDAEQAERRAAFDAQRIEEAEKDTADAEEQVVDPSKQAKTAWWLNAAREALRGEQRVVTSALKIIPILNEARTGFEGRSDMRAWVDTVDATFDKLLPPDNPRAKDFATQLSSGTGSMAGFLALSALGGWAGLGEKASTTIIGSAVGATSQFEDAEQHDATAFQKYIALIAGAGLGATEAIPIDRMFRRANDATGGLVTRMLVNTAAGSLEEFIQELGQNVGSDMAAWIYDPEREVDVKGALQAGIVGGISGGMTASAMTTLSEAGVIPSTESDQEGTETATQKKPDETAQQEDFLKRFFAQTQQQLDQMREQADAVDAIVAPPVEAEAQGEVAPLDPAAIAEAVKGGGPRPRTQMATDFVDMLDRPTLFEPSGVTGAGGTMPRTTADGNITLRHYANEAREELDPERMGSGPLVGVERARLTGPDATPRTYFGVDSGEDFVQPSVGLKEYTSVSPEEVAAAKSIGLTKAQLQAELERRWFREAQSGGYVNEGLGSISHEVTVSRNDLYNMVEDKLGLRQQLSPDLSPNERLTQYEGLVKNAGFRGAYFPRGELGQTAILFNKEKPSRVMNERYGVPANEVATPADFDAPTADTFKKAGWAVVTATREADGPFSSEANIKANNKMRQQLRRDGVQYKEVSGAYKGTPQGSNFLVFAPEDYAIKLGKQYKQESVLTRDGLVYTDGSDSLTPGRGTVVGDQARDADFFSTLPDGTSFTMDLDFDATGPRGEVLRAQQTPLPYDTSMVTIHPDDVTVLPEDLETLPGNTSGKPVESVVRAARAYAQSRGIPVRRQAEYVKADPERGKRIAAAYEAMKDDPTDPEVAAAYDAMIEETLAQYQFVKATGLTVEAIEQGQDDPYPEGPKQVLTDLENGHLWFFPTDQGFGTLTEAQAANPLLRPTDEYIGDRQLLANDVFRIVHDFFGHGIEGSGFGARGEENAWQSHMRLYTPAALPAVTSETRGQNSWVNFGPHGEENRNNQRETVYADQKAGIMPSWTWQEGVADEFPSSEFLANVAMPMDQAKVAMDGMAGYAGVMRYLTDEEKVGMRAASAQKIVDIFTSLPTPEETAAVAVAGSAKRGWYDRSAKAIVDIFGAQDAPRFAALLAALSPQTSVESNAINALRVWTAWVRAGRPTEEKRIRQLLGLNVQGGGTSGSVLPAWIPNSLRALQAEDPTTVRLSGPKVDSFAKNLRGVVEEVTNDTWMANYAFIEQRVFKGSGNPVALKSPGYKAMSALVRASAEVATEITGDTWTPAEIQETVWSWAKALYEKAGGVDAETLLMSGGLTDADIASTPDFAVLFAEGVYRRVLEEGGYGIPDNSTGSGRSSAVDGERSVLEASEGTTLDGGTFERHLRNAARRLDALRKRRAEQEGGEDVAQREASQAEELNVSDQDIDDFLGQRRGGGGTSSSRGPLRGEQTRPRRGIPGQTQSASDEISLAKIAQNVIDQLGLTARQGRFTLKGSNVVGQFSQKQNVVRLKTWNDLSTLVHEGGHALQLAADGPLKAWINANGSGLADLARAIYGGDTSKMKPAEKVAEGFAEFFRLYTLNRGFATQKYPTLTQTFDDLLTQHNPQLKTGLGLIGDQFAAWLQLPSAQLVRNMVTTGKQETGVNAAVKELQDKGFGNWFNEVVTQTIQSTTNRFANLNKIVSEVLNLGEQNTGASIDLKRAEDPRVLIRLAANVGNRAMIQTTDGVMAYRGVSPTTRGLRAAMLRYHGLNEDQHLQQIDPERQRDFAAYLVALRGVDEYRRLAEGKIERPPVAATLGDLQLTIKEMNSRYGADFSEAAQIVHEYGMALWQKAYDAGLMSKQTFKDGLDRQFYAPLQRDMSDRDVSTSDIAEASATGKGRSVVKRFRGSDRDIIDPMDALMQKTFSLERVIVENDIKLSLARLADKAGKAGAMVERVPAHQLLGQEYSVQEIARQLTKDDTLTETDAQDLMNILEASIEEGNRVALFRSQQAMAKGDNVLFFWENGKLAAIQLKDGDVGADVINTTNGIGRENMPVFLETVAAASTAFRTAITSWPDFLLVNFIRDQASAFILTDVGYKPFYTGLKGVGDEVRQTEWARLYNAGMGIMGGMNTAALHKARVDRDLDALRGKGYLVRAFAEKGMLGKIKGLGRVVELTETGSRLGIFRAAYDRGKKDGLTDYEATIEASYLSTDYIDFGLNGNRMLMWRRLVPFLNAQLQGLYKLGRTLGGDEVRQRKGINFALRAYFKDLNKLDLSRTERQALQTGRKAWLKMMSLGFIGAALSMAFWDDPDYQDASEYLRATGWVIPIGDGRIFYIPKPFELAVFSNFVERGIEAATGDSSAPKRFMRGLAMNLTPPVAPPAIQSVIEQIANYDFFSEREIVPDYMRALAPELQYNNYTSDFAKQVGGIVGLSPMRVDHLLSGLGASAYRDLTFMYNSVLGADRPSSDVTNWPITRRFVRDARRGSTSAADFWSYASTVSGSLRSAEVSYKNLFESGQERAAEDFLNTLDPDARAYAVLNTHFKADAKRLNPFYRARQIGTIVSAMRREMVAPVGVENSETKFSEPVKLSAEEKYKSDTLLSEYIRREMRNTLIYMQDPGWSNKTPLPTDTTLDLLSKTNPFIAEELKRRIDKASIYSAETVQEYWPEARDRLLSDREGAFLKDLVSVAKVMK